MAKWAFRDEAVLREQKPANSQKYEQMAAYYREAIAEGLEQFDKGQNDDSLYDALVWEGLYAIDKFFVEVEWNIEKEKIVGKGEFKCGDTLDMDSNVPKEICLKTHTTPKALIKQERLHTL